MSKSELKVEYDAEMKPVSATCGACGEKMPAPPADLLSSADIIMWWSGQYLDHRAKKHSHGARVTE